MYNIYVIIIKKDSTDKSISRRMISKIWQIGFAHTKGLKIKVNADFLENNPSDT